MTCPLTQIPLHLSHDLLNGQRPEMPPVGANVTFQKAERVKTEEGKQTKLW